MVKMVFKTIFLWVLLISMAGQAWALMPMVLPDSTLPEMYPPVPEGLKKSGTISCKDINKRFSVKKKYIKVEGNGIEIDGICSGEIKDSYIDAGAYGIKINGNNTITISNCTIIGGKAGIWVDGITDVTIKDSKVISSSRGIVADTIGKIKVINSEVNGKDLAADIQGTASLLVAKSRFPSAINLSSFQNKFKDLGGNEIEEVTQGESQFYAEDKAARERKIEEYKARGKKGANKYKPKKRKWAQQGKNAKLGKAPKTEREYREKAHQWLSGLIEAVMNEEYTGALSCEEEAKSYVEDMVHLIVGQHLDILLNEMVNRGRELIDGQCNDALTAFAYSYGYWLQNSRWPTMATGILPASKKGYGMWLDDEKEKVERALSNVYDMLKKGRYPYSLRFFAAFRLIGISNDEKWSRLAIENLSDAVKEGEFSNNEITIAYRLATMIEVPDNVLKWEKLNTLLTGKSNINPWFRNMVKGEMHVDQAWEARGGGYATTVTEAGWERFKSQMKKARRYFVAAWEEKPDYPEAARRLVLVAKVGIAGYKESARVWFNRSIDAQFDYMPAYKEYISDLHPKWHGNHKVMNEFGLECLKTERFDTLVPLIYLRILRETESGNRYRWWKKYREPEVQKNIDLLFSKMLKAPEHLKDRDRLKIQYAMVLMWMGDREKAKSVLTKSDRSFDLEKGFFRNQPLADETLSWEIIEGELSAFTGPHKETLEKAEALCLKDEWESAIRLYENVMQEYRGVDENAHAFLLRRICLIKMEEEMSFSYYLPRDIMHIAIYHKRLSTVEYILKHSNHTHKRFRDGDNVLHLSSTSGNLAITRLLFDNGADIHARNDFGWQPIHKAIRYKNTEIAEFLLLNGAEPNSKTNYGWAPLHLAARIDEPLIVSLLLAKGADRNIKDKQGRTPLDIAEQWGHPEVIKLLESGVGGV